MKRNILIATLSVLMVSGIAFFSACNDDSPKPKVALSSNSFTGKVGQVATTTATATADAGVKSIKITKYIGTTVDNSYGTNGTLTVNAATYALSYTLSGEGLSNPVRFNFVVEDNDGATNSGSVDFVVTTEITLRYVLTAYDWQWESKFGKDLVANPAKEQILPCELDNEYVFTDTLALDYGPLTGAGGGTCDFDALIIGSSWELNDATNELKLHFFNAFNGLVTETYQVTAFSATQFTATSFVDLSVFGPEYAAGDWTFKFKAKAK